MPQTTVDIEAKTERNITHIKATNGDEVVTSKVNSSKLSTIQDAIEWIVSQRQKTLSESEIQRRVTFTYHVDDGQVIVDSIDNVQPLPKDQGKTDFENLPNWATWTAQQAVDWIDTNVVDLDSAKIVLQQMARAIIALRNINVDGGQEHS